MPDSVEIEVVVAWPDQQYLVELSVPEGTTVGEAIQISGLADKLPGFDAQSGAMGIFGKACRPERVLKAGERVELYRPLVADPKTIRRELAEIEKSGRRNRN